MFHFNENRAACKLNSTFPKSDSSCLETSSEVVNTIFDGPGRKPQSQQVFSRRGDSFENYTVHVCMFFF